MNVFLIIFIYIYSGSVDGGAYVSSVTVPMANMKVCEVAAEKAKQPDAFKTGSMGLRFGIHFREAICVSNVAE